MSELSDEELQALSEEMNVTKEDIEVKLQEDTPDPLRNVFRMPDIPIASGPVSKIVLNEKQKNTIHILTVHLTSLKKKPDAVNIFNAWPTQGRAMKEKSGPQPTITSISEYQQSNDYADSMVVWGIEVGTNPGGLTTEMLAVLENISDTSKMKGLGARLKEAGVTWSKFNAWRKIPAFEEALTAKLGNSLNDSVLLADVQLASLAQNGDLKAIQYLNEMVGRGPNNKKAVDAVAFARIILESVMRRVRDPQIIKEISADIELAAKSQGLTALE